MSPSSCTMGIMESGRSGGDIWIGNSIRGNVKGKKCMEM